MKKSDLDVRTAHRVAALGNLSTIRNSLKDAGNRRTTARLILESVVSQYNADPDRAAERFETALLTAADEDRPYVVDLYVPVLLMQGQISNAHLLLESVVAVPRELTVLFAALKQLVSAMDGKTQTEVRPQFDNAISDISRARVLQRLATAAYYCGLHDAAIDNARRAARILIRLRSHRSAAAALSIAYNIQHVVLGDVEEAYRTARALTDCAVRAKDRSFEISGLIAQYEIAAEFGDAGVVSKLKTAINRKALPNQYLERFARAVADALPYAWDGNFAAFRANAVMMRELQSSRPVLALIAAFRSIAEAALGDMEAARRNSRSAIGLAAISSADEAPYESRYRRLARSIAAACCVLIGDSARGRRAIQSRGFSGTEADAIVASATGVHWHEAPRSVRGYARMIVSAHGIVSARTSHNLTAAELDVLQMLADGKSAPQVAAEINRSVHTVRAHTRHIIEKFDVNGRGAAISHARRARLIS